MSLETFTRLHRLSERLKEEIAILEPHLASLGESKENTAMLLANYTEGLIAGMEIAIEFIKESKDAREQ